jgi:hypothetical protein
MLRDAAEVRDNALRRPEQMRDTRSTARSAHGTTAPSARPRRSILGRLPRMQRPDGSPIVYGARCSTRAVSCVGPVMWLRIMTRHSMSATLFLMVAVAMCTVHGMKLG